MVRAILIDPDKRTVSETKISDRWSDIQRVHDGGRLTRVATLPKGDGVYVPQHAGDDAPCFRLGGSKPFQGSGLVLGRRGQWGLFCDAVTDVDAVASLAGFERA